MTDDTNALTLDGGQITARLLGVILAHQTTKGFYPSFGDLMAAMKMSERSLWQLLAELERKEIVKVLIACPYHLTLENAHANRSRDASQEVAGAVPPERGPVVAAKRQG